ncbi:unnamed protein product [Peronospora destructor]|uniref:Reverse transcriptase domain-containing protein n=1 Tax=Peronospora destructor TaxID=86335 RepID=A0AAV0TL62_9STRA|nr:unnamed protein product [Peronospora destructor]
MNPGHSRAEVPNNGWDHQAIIRREQASRVMDEDLKPWGLHSLEGAEELIRHFEGTQYRSEGAPNDLLPLPETRSSRGSVPRASSGVSSSCCVRAGLGEVVVKLADGKPRRAARRELSLSYTFDGFRSIDDFLPQIDWLARSVKRRSGFDVSEVFTHLLVAPRDWPHVTVVDKTSTTQAVHRVSDGPLCTACTVLLDTGGGLDSSCNHERDIDVVEQGLPREINAVENGFPQERRVVEQGFPHETSVVEQGLPHENTVGNDISPRDCSSPALSSNSEQHEIPRIDAPASVLFNVIEYVDGAPQRRRVLEVASPPRDASSITRLPGLSWKHFLRDLKDGGIEEVCLIIDEAIDSTFAVSDGELPTRPPSAEPKSAREERFASQSWDALRDSGNPVYDIAREYADVFPDKIPAELPADRDVLHEIDLVLGSKYCLTRQWPLPRDQTKAIDDFFEDRRKSGHVRESISRHSSPTFCVKKATGGWRIVHAFTIPAQTPIPRKDMVLNSMSGSVLFSAIDLTDGFYQILMRPSDIPLAAVSTQSGMLWEWLVIPQGLKNAPATFNRMVSHVFRPLREFAPSYFDDISVHSRAEGDLSAKCVFCAPEIPVLGCYVSKSGVRADPEKISSICSWPTPKNPTELRQWLGLANYLHKYTKDYAGSIQPLSSLLKEDATWTWRPEHQSAFDAVKKSLASAPVLIIPDDSKPFHVVCDASDFAIGCALMQFDHEGRERVVSYQSRQLKPAEKNYPVHDKELLAMRYALIKFRVHLLGEQTFALYTDHASLRTAMKSPHLSQRMARWLSFFSEYNFVGHYKPGKNNILADALSRRPDYDPRMALSRQQADDDDDDDGDSCMTCIALNMTKVSAELPLYEEIAKAYEVDPDYGEIVAYLRAPTSINSMLLGR